MNLTALPEHMAAIEIIAPGGPDVLQPTQIRRPYPGEGQLLIKVSAAGVNRPDILQRQGLYPAPTGVSEIPGLEVSGEVIVAGRHTNRFQPGDRVCALVSGGGYSEYCLTDEATTLPIPAGLSDVEAAGLPEACFTVWHNVFERGLLKAGEWLLVHGGTSGIGTMAIQFGSALGSKVLTTASSPEKCVFCEKLGATKAINYLEDDFVDGVKAVTDGYGADVILDMIGGDIIDRNIKTAAADGRIVQIAFLNGSVAEVDFMRLMLKRLTLTGSTLRARPLSVKAHIAKALETHIWPLLNAGKIKPIIDRTFALADAREAHMHMESRQHIGKIILTV